MNKFKLEIQLGNDAMQTYGDIELALRQVCHRMRRNFNPLEVPTNKTGNDGKILDANGNKVGFWMVVKPL